MVNSSLVKISGSLLLISILVACSPSPTPPQDIHSSSAPEIALNKKMQNQSAKASMAHGEAQKKIEAITADNFSGFYANEEYAKRKHGADWTGFRITHLKNGQYKVQIEGRVIHKKSTCSGTFTNAHAIHTHTLKVPTEVGAFTLTLKDKTLSVDAEKSSTLYYFCSGGASLRGSYTLVK